MGAVFAPPTPVGHTTRGMACGSSSIHPCATCLDPIHPSAFCTVRCAPPFHRTTQRPVRNPPSLSTVRSRPSSISTVDSSPHVCPVQAAVCPVAVEDSSAPVDLSSAACGPSRVPGLPRPHRRVRRAFTRRARLEARWRWPWTLSHLLHVDLRLAKSAAWSTGCWARAAARGGRWPKCRR